MILKNHTSRRRGSGVAAVRSLAVRTETVPGGIGRELNAVSGAITSPVKTLPFSDLAGVRG
jgi:hypothetical protein